MAGTKAEITTAAPATPPAPAPATPPAVPPAVSSASLVKITDATTTLNAAVDKITDAALKTEVQDRINADINLFKNAGIDQLDDNKKTIHLSDTENSAGLIDRQNKTKKFISDRLKADKELAAIEAALDTLHKERSNFLTKSLNDQTQDGIDKAYDDLRDIMQLGSPSVTTARPVGAAPTSGLLDELRAAPNNALASPDTGIQLSLRNDELQCNNPEALGAALAAAGPEYREASHISGPPWNVIAAAKSAHRHGVKVIHISDRTRGYFTDRNNFRSEAEYLKANEELRAIDNTNAANLAAARTKPNTVFNTAPTPSHQAQVFNLLNPNEPGHAQMIASRTAEELVDLAREIDGAGSISYQKSLPGGKATVYPSAKEYIRSHLDPIKKQAFDQRDAHLTAKATVDNDKDFQDLKVEYNDYLQNPGDTDERKRLASQVAKVMTKSDDKAVRELFYAKIQEFGDPDFKLELQKALLRENMDRYLKDAFDSSGNVKILRYHKIEDEHKEEAGKILTSTTERQRDAVFAGLNHRLLIKLQNFGGGYLIKPGREFSLKEVLEVANTTPRFCATLETDSLDPADNKLTDPIHVKRFAELLEGLHVKRQEMDSNLDEDENLSLDSEDEELESGSSADLSDDELSEEEMDQAQPSPRPGSGGPTDV